MPGRDLRHLEMRLTYSCPYCNKVGTWGCEDSIACRKVTCVHCGTLFLLVSQETFCKQRCTEKIECLAIPTIFSSNLIKDCATHKGVLQ